MKYATQRPYADVEVAARKLVEIANSVEAVQDGRIYIELINAPMLKDFNATLAEYKAGLDLAVAKGWLELHGGGTFVRFTQPAPIYLPDPNRNGCRGPTIVSVRGGPASNGPAANPQSQSARPLRSPRER